MTNEIKNWPLYQKMGDKIFISQRYVTFTRNIFLYGIFLMTYEKEELSVISLLLISFVNKDLYL